MKIEIVEPAHHSDDFSCGVSSLDLYLQKQAIKDTCKQLSLAYVLNNKDKIIAGYYTLSSTMIELANDDIISGVLISRLAVDKQHQKNGYGELLLLDALHRAYSLHQKNNLCTVVVNSINKNATRFYKKYGFTNFVNQNDMLYLPQNMNAVFA